MGPQLTFTAEVGRRGAPDGADARRSQHGLHGMLTVGQVTCRGHSGGRAWAQGVSGASDPPRAPPTPESGRSREWGQPSPPHAPPKAQTRPGWMADRRPPQPLPRSNQKDPQPYRPPPRLLSLHARHTTRGSVTAASLAPAAAPSSPRLGCLRRPTLPARGLLTPRLLTPGELPQGSFLCGRSPDPGAQDGHPQGTWYSTPTKLTTTPHV